MATQSSILAWRIPWTEEPGGLHRESGTTEHIAHTHTASFWFLRSLAFAGGCCLQAYRGRGPGLTQHPPVPCSWSEGQQWTLVHALV